MDELPDQIEDDITDEARYSIVGSYIGATLPFLKEIQNILNELYTTMDSDLEEFLTLKYRFDLWTIYIEILWQPMLEAQVILQNQEVQFPY